MTLDEINTIGQTVAAVATVATVASLVFADLLVRQNTRSAEPRP